MTSAPLLLLLLAAVRAADLGPTSDFEFLRDPAYLFTFGDSYTSENWDWGNQPNPIEDHKRVTWCNGPTWARNLSRQYTSNTLVNYAVGGATIDNSVVHNWDIVLDLQGQVRAFEKHFAGGNSPWVASSSGPQAPWNSSNALFALEFGTNDVWSSFRGTPRQKRLNQTESELQTELAWHLLDAAERLRLAGARAFAFVTVLPFDRARLGVSAGPEEQLHLRESLRSFNEVVGGKMERWCRAEGLFCVTVDTYSLAQRIMRDPVSYGFKEAFDYCEPYTYRYSVEPDEYVDPRCLGPVREYLWRDGVHPSYGFHELWAALFRDTIERELNRRTDAVKDEVFRLQNPPDRRIRPRP
ncbi:hypothetical protein EXIGLDRAFT_718464 [Exidia glandulosa HHB12029]|uniref:SGNH hydrolase n=1 Tax=Exidia glandulosa HHB12029 TaxID=1314781 RepID=A0A165NWK8_EXIGL|nr:hypothetical protein EXIGLDRAFT_718464 [Exidia glandulosa HHB12029]